MNMRAKLFRAVLPAALLVGAFAAPAAAQLPAARTLVDRHVQLIGGRDAVMAATDGKTVGTFSLPAVGLVGPMETYVTGGKVLSIITLPGLGEIRSGFDGQVAWAADPMQGARVLQGVEREQLLEQTDPLAGVRDASRLQSLETVGEETLGGVACWKVRLVWNSGRETFDCYAKETGLLHATVAVMASPMGQMTNTTLMLDYADVGGIKSPKRLVMQTGGQEMSLSIDVVERGAQPDTLFALPAEIKALSGN